MARGYGCVPRTDWRGQQKTPVLANETPFFWYEGDDGLWRLGKIDARKAMDGGYFVRFLATTRGRSKRKAVLKDSLIFLVSLNPSG